jgi:hypothetical protein
MWTEAAQMEFAHLEQHKQHQEQVRQEKNGYHAFTYIAVVESGGIDFVPGRYIAKLSHEFVEQLCLRLQCHICLYGLCLSLLLLLFATLKKLLSFFTCVCVCVLVVVDFILFFF